MRQDHSHVPEHGSMLQYQTVDLWFPYILLQTWQKLKPHSFCLQSLNFYYTLILLQKVQSGLLLLKKPHFQLQCQYIFSLSKQIFLRLRPHQISIFVSNKMETRHIPHKTLRFRREVLENIVNGNYNIRIIQKVFLNNGQLCVWETIHEDFFLVQKK